jgi:hypothetical protein
MCYVKVAVHSWLTKTQRYIISPLYSCGALSVFHCILHGVLNAVTCRISKQVLWSEGSCGTCGLMTLSTSLYWSSGWNVAKMGFAFGLEYCRGWGVQIPVYVLMTYTDNHHSWFQAFAMFWMSCVIFWVVHRRMVFNSQCFGTLCLFDLHRRVDAKWVRIDIVV